MELTRLDTTADVLLRRSTVDPQSPALVAADGETLSGAELNARATGIARSLATAQIRTDRSRPRIAIVLPNGVSIAVAMLGSSVFGEAAPLNPEFTAAEFEQYFQMLNIDAVIVASEGQTISSTVAEAGLKCQPNTDA